ncbi:Protein of unknown function (DUF4050) domain containing protein [Elaphomyces granulatus]
MDSTPPITSSYPSSFLRSNSRASDATKETREAAVREARQRMREVVRDDWSHEPFLLYSPQPTSMSSMSSLASTPSAIEMSPSQELSPAIVDWRLREYATSESEQDSAISSGDKRERDIYRFENPDAVQATVAARRRKRRMERDDEMVWNPGLRIWVERRNAWTGARKKKSVAQAFMLETGEIDPQAVEASPTGVLSAVPPREKGPDHGEDHTDGSGNADTEITNNQRHEGFKLFPGFVPCISATGEPSRVVSFSLGRNDREDTAVSESTRVIYDHSGSGLGEQLNDFASSNESLVPVVEPFLPSSNPVRAAINPSIYRSIYSKVVIQGLTPAVPINLADLTKAVVEGWKADGQWPPKPAPQIPGADVLVRRKGANDADNGVTASKAHKASISHGSGVTSAVKKVLGLSGIHNHPFHLRRSSQSRNGPDGDAGTGEGGGTTVPVTHVVDEPHR